MAEIHPTAVIEEGATLASSARVGPYCVVGKEVSLAEDVELISHVVVAGQTTIGAGTRVFPFASLGHAPQDLKFKGEHSQLIIGAHNTIREHVTMNPGTDGGGLVTRVGDHNLFMVATHVAHDCHIGNHVVMANNATLAGHVTIGDHTVIGGLAAVHQFVRIGKHAMIGGMSGVAKDVIPYGTVMGNRAALTGLNLIGLKRREFSRDAIHALRGAYKALFEEQDGTLEERISHVANRYADIPEVADVLTFLQAETDRSFCTPARSGLQEAA